jgi:hypothetical protein
VPCTCYTQRPPKAVARQPFADNPDPKSEKMSKDKPDAESFIAIKVLLSTSCPPTPCKFRDISVIGSHEYRVKKTLINAQNVHKTQIPSPKLVQIGKTKTTTHFVTTRNEGKSGESHKVHLMTPQFSTAPRPVDFSFFLKAFQNRRVSSPAPVTMTWPSGLIAR